MCPDRPAVPAPREVAVAVRDAIWYAYFGQEPERAYVRAIVEVDSAADPDSGRRRVWLNWQEVHDDDDWRSLVDDVASMPEHRFASLVQGGAMVRIGPHQVDNHCYGSRCPSGGQPQPVHQR